MQLEQPTFLPFVAMCVHEAGLKPGSLIVELTESYLSSNYVVLTDVLDALRVPGVRVTMDDLGRDIPIANLKRNPVDIVKIDRVFVKDILHSSFDATFIRCIVALCHDVGIEVCLEGVESAEVYP